MKKLATYCGLAALAGGAFFVVDAADDTVYVWGTDTCGTVPASLGRVKALFE